MIPVPCPRLIRSSSAYNDPFGFRYLINDVHDRARLDAQLVVQQQGGAEDDGGEECEAVEEMIGNETFTPGSLPETLYRHEHVVLVNRARSLPVPVGPTPFRSRRNEMMNPAPASLLSDQHVPPPAVGVSRPRRGILKRRRSTSSTFKAVSQALAILGGKNTRRVRFKLGVRFRLDNDEGVCGSGAEENAAKGVTGEMKNCKNTVATVAAVEARLPSVSSQRQFSEFPYAPFGYVGERIIRRNPARVRSNLKPKKSQKDRGNPASSPPFSSNETAQFTIMTAETSEQGKTGDTSACSSTAVSHVTPASTPAKDVDTAAEEINPDEAEYEIEYKEMLRELCALSLDWIQ